MAFFDLSPQQLEVYRSDLVEPADFDAFWLRTVGESLAASGAPRLARLESPLVTVQVFELEFDGYQGQAIKGWFMVPGDFDPASSSLPCIVQYQGYGGGRAYPHDWLVYPSAGYATLVMDSRGQGSAWSRGDTPDVEAPGGSPQYPGFMTRGILSPESYYYRRLFVDAVLAARTASLIPGVDPGRIALAGASQGGGISIAAAGILGILKQAATSGDTVLQAMAKAFPDPVGVLPDVPFLCDMRRATAITNSFPYQELVAWFRQHREETEQAFATLNYFDCVHFARRARGRALFSVALMDDCCPPSTVYGAYNAWSGPASIEVFPYNGHEGGASCHQVTKLEFVAELFNNI